MTRNFVIGLAVLGGLAAAVEAGGPPPVYVVVDKVVLGPTADAPTRIQIWGSFVRLENDREYRYGKPVEGFVDLGLDPRKAAETRVEWVKWQKAAGTGRVVAVGSCHEAGTLLTVKIRKPGERPERPDATYTPDRLERFGGMYVDGDLEREAAVQSLLAFVKERAATRAAAGRPGR
jgi:hypothetical protein